MTSSARHGAQKTSSELYYKMLCLWLPQEVKGFDSVNNILENVHFVAESWIRRVVTHVYPVNREQKDRKQGEIGSLALSKSPTSSIKSL